MLCISFLDIIWSLFSLFRALSCALFSSHVIAYCRHFCSTSFFFLLSCLCLLHLASAWNCDHQTKLPLSLSPPLIIARQSVDSSDHLGQESIQSQSFSLDGLGRGGELELDGLPLDRLLLEEIMRHE